jgi:hypothetical protein
VGGGRGGRAVGLAGLAGFAMLDHDTSSPPLTDAEIAAQCREHYTGLNPNLTSEPEQRFVSRHGGDQVRIYVSEADNWMIACRSDAIGVTTFATIMEADTKAGIQDFGGWDSAVKANLVVGRLPARTTAIRARLVTGEVVDGFHDGDLFVVWLSEGSVQGARLIATAADGSVIAEAVAPTQD